MKDSLKWLCGVGALALPLSVAAAPAVEDLTLQSNSLYQQANTRLSGGGTLTLLNQLDEQAQEIARLRGRVDELEYQFKRLTEMSQQRYLDLEQRVSGTSPAGENGQEVDAQTAAAVSGGAGSNASSANASSGGDAQKDYENAFAKVQSRDFDGAIDAFESFVVDHGDSNLAANAHYWLAELYSAQHQLDPSAQAFDTVISEFSQSSKVPDAMYKLGLVKARQGKAQESRKLLEELVRQYPDSKAGGMAKDFLASGA